MLSGKPETEQTLKQEYRFFKRDVLKSAIAEVNAVTDLSVQLVEYKAGRFISDLQFKVERKVLQDGQPAGSVEPLDLTLLSKARSLGIDERSSEQFLDEFGDALMRVGLELLEKRITSGYPEPLREPGRYLQTVLAAERRRVAQTNESIRSSGDAAAAASLKPDPQTSAPSKIVEMKRQARWHEEWLRRRRERVVADLNALSQEEQGRLTQELLSDMETRRVHPSIRKRLQVNGWQHPMVLQEMVRFFAVSCIGDGWDKPTPQQLLEIATQMGDG